MHGLKGGPEGGRATRKILRFWHRRGRGYPLALGIVGNPGMNLTFIYRQAPMRAFTELQTSIFLLTKDIVK